MADVEVTATGNVSGVLTAFEKMGQSASSMAGKVESSAGRAESSSEGMRGKITEAVGGIVAAMGIGFGVDKVIEFGKSVLEAGNEASTSMAQTSAVLKSTGGSAGITSEGIDKLTESISKKTATDALQVRSGENMLLTFTGIKNAAGKGNDVFNQSTSILTDMSRAMGTDMKTSAIQLGKALNDPATGMNALRRVGVSFSASEQEQIKTMMAHNNIIGAQKVMLHELGTEFGGSGAAYAKSYAGSVSLFRNSLEDLKIAIAQRVEPALAGLARLGTGAMDWLTSKLPSVGKSTSTLTGFFDKIVAAAKGLMPPIIQVVRSLSPFNLVLKAIEPILPILAKNLNAVAQTLAGALGVAFKAVLPPMLQMLLAVLKFAQPLLESKTAIMLVVGAFIAWKAVMGVISLVSAAMAAYKGVQEGVALGTKVFTAAQEEATIAQKLGAAGTIAMSVASKIAAAGQWLLNAALSANPIGIVIVLIAALVAGLVWFFTQTKIGRDIVKVAMKDIGDVWNWLWRSVIQPVIKWVSDAWRVLVAVFQADVAVWRAVFNAVGAAIRYWWTGTVSPVINFVKTAWAVLARGFQIEGQVIGAAVGTVARFFSGLWSTLSGIFGRIGSAWGSLWRGAAGVLGSAFSGVVSVVRGAINGVIGTINGAISAIDSIHVSIPKGVPLVGGLTFGVSIPTIPMLAKGGFVLRGGDAIVGENGPERLSLPPGAMVRPLNGSETAGGGGGNHYEFNILMPPGSTRDDRAYAEDLLGKIRFAVTSIAGGAYG